MQKGWHRLAWFIAVLGAMALWASPAGAQQTSDINWVEGDNQYELAVASVGGSCDALAASDGSVKLALATGENWPDALAASALDRPLLLTPRASLHPATRSFVDGCSGSVHVIIIGGTAAVSQQVKTALTALGATVQRIKGDHRYETARKIAESAAGSKVDLVYLATGANFADAIAAAPRVTTATPLVLTPTAALGADAEQFLRTRLAPGGSVVVLGGIKAVSKAAHDAVDELGFTPRRIEGGDRYATSARTARESLQDPACTTVDNVAFASGTVPYGGLAAASVRGPCEPLLLVPPPGASVPSSLPDFLQTWSAALNSNGSAACRVSMVGQRSTLGVGFLQQSDSALQTAGCTPLARPPTDDDSSQPDDDGEQFRGDAIETLQISTNTANRVLVENSSGPDIDVTEWAHGWNWWRDWGSLPRGDLTVNVHLCVMKGLESLFSRSNLQAIATSYDRYIAPFYAWQSSDLIGITFRPGEIIVSEDLAPGLRLGYGGQFAPRDCLARFEDAALRDVVANWEALGHRTPIKREAHVAHAFLVYGEGLELGSGGLGQLGGPFSVTYAEHDPAVPEPWRRFVASEDPRDWLPFVVQHEVDHNIEAVHHNGAEFGHIRVWTHPADSGHVGSLEGYPDIKRLRVRDDRSGLTRYSVYPCYELSRSGWPMGEGHPACARIPPPEPQNVKFDQLGNEGVRLTWSPPSKEVNPEPVTGYEISLSEWRPVGDSVFGTEVAETYNVGADASSFTIPKGKTNWTAYGAQVLAVSAAGKSDAVWATAAVPIASELGLDQFHFFANNEVTTKQVQTGHGPDFIGINLSWPAVPGATHYQLTGFENCGSICRRGIYEPSVTLDEGTGHLVSGKSYDVEIYACNEDASLIETCALFAVVTIDLTKGRLVHSSVSLKAIGQPLGGRHTYLAEWAPHATSSTYMAIVSWCEDDSPSWCGVHGNSGSYSIHYQVDDIQISATKVTTSLELDSGTHYWVDVHVCGASDNQQQPRSCPVHASGEVTVPS